MILPFRPSRTALGSAAARAAHLIVDGEPTIYADPLAGALLGPDAEPMLAFHRVYSSTPVLAGARTEAVCRSRFAADARTRSGAGQHVILGAGLDTTAYRPSGCGPTTSPATPAASTVLEVDTPEMSRWKRAALARAGIDVPASARLVGADLRTDPLLPALTAAGFDADRPAFVSCLGVMMYLTPASVAVLLQSVAACAPGTVLVADYLLAPHLRDEPGSAYAAAVGQAAGENGEPWLSTWTPADLTAALRHAGFTDVTHRTQRDAIDPVLWDRTDALRPMALSGLVQAAVGPR